MTKLQPIAPPTDATARAEVMAYELALDARREARTPASLPRDNRRKCEHCGIVNWGGARFCGTQECGGSTRQLVIGAVRS